MSGTLLDSKLNDTISPPSTNPYPDSGIKSTASSKRRRTTSSAGESRWGGFSSIKTLKELNEIFNEDFTCFENQPFLSQTNQVAGLNREQLLQFASGVAVVRKIVNMENEKSLYLPIYDLLKLPLILTNLQLDVIDDDHPEQRLSFNPNIMISHEDYLKGTVRGPVEYIIKTKDNKPVLTIEVKQTIEFGHTFEKWNGIFQLLGQMFVQFVPSRDGVAYGALTDMKYWVFVKMTLSTPSYRVEFSEKINAFHPASLRTGWEVANDIHVLFAYLLQILAVHSESEITGPELIQNLPHALSMIEAWNDEFSESYIQMLQKDIDLARANAENKELKNRLEQAERVIEELERQIREKERTEC